MHRITSTLAVLLLASCAGPRDPSGDVEDLVSTVGRFVETAQVVATEGGARIPSPDELTAHALEKLPTCDVDRHFPYLLEYGLKFHRGCLEFSGLAREIPAEGNHLFAELIRLAKIPKYRTPHEAGWLAAQFYGPFERSGWSSYQVYLWAKEHPALDGYPNRDRIASLLARIDASPACKVGGDGVCHYGCR